MNKEIAGRLYGGPERPAAECEECREEEPEGRADVPEDALVLPEHLRKRTRRRRRGQEGGRRVPFDRGQSFYELRARAMRAGVEAGSPFEGLFAHLKTCEPKQKCEAEENRGASYDHLECICKLALFSREERCRFYRIAEHVGLSDRLAGHLIASLKREGGQR